MQLLIHALTSAGGGYDKVKVCKGDYTSLFYMDVATFSYSNFNGDLGNLCQ